ncbi:MAG: hypothetical protein AB1586_11670 [Pseudomonadota bacterium]|jgi:hypothetical protein
MKRFALSIAALAGLMMATSASAMPLSQPLPSAEHAASDLILARGGHGHGHGYGHGHGHHGRHLGWTRGRHVGWSHSRHRWHD